MFQVKPDAMNKILYINGGSGSTTLGKYPQFDIETQRRNIV